MIYYLCCRAFFWSLSIWKVLQRRRKCSGMRPKKSHSRPRSPLVNVCNYSFWQEVISCGKFQKSRLPRHLKMHTNVKVVEQDGFSRVSTSEDKHNLRSLETSRFPCHERNKVFERKFNLKHHYPHPTLSCECKTKNDLF